MLRNLLLIKLIIFSILVLVNLAVAETSTDHLSPKVKIISLGSVPDDVTLIQQSLKFSHDMRNVTYVTYNDKKENIVRLNNSTSPRYYAVRPGTPLFNPENHRHAYIAASGKKGKNAFAVVDEKPDPSFDIVDKFAFSFDGTRYAYRAVRNNKQCIVVDGKPGPLYDGIPLNKNLAFSMDSKHIAYVAFNDNSCFLVVDGNEQKKYNFINEVTFSPDSNHISYKARIGKSVRKEKWCVVSDGVESKIYDGLFIVVYSPDSKHVAFVAYKDKQMYLVIDGKEKTSHKNLGFPVFSPDSQRFSYAFSDKYNWRISVDNKIGPSFDNVVKFYFSPDSSRYAYTAINDNEFYCIVDGMKIGPYSMIKTFKFSQDSKRYAFSASDDEGARIVTDGKPGIIYQSVGEPYFSPDSKTIVYRALNKNRSQWVTVVNNKEQSQFYFSIKDYNFSQDSKRMAFATMIDKGKTLFVVDGKEHPVFTILGMPAFSPDGKHIAYHALTVDEKWCLVVDGKQLPETYGGFMRGTPIVFDSNTHFHTIAMREPGPEFLRIEVDIP